MGAKEPGEVIKLFTKYFNAADAEGILSLYEKDASFVAGPGAGTLDGVDAIRTAIEGFTAGGGTMKIVDSAIYVNGDIALTHNRWSWDTGQGEPQTAVTAEVVRRQPDGTWLYAIDNPWGGGVLDTIQ